MFNRRTKETDLWNFFEKFNKRQSLNIACVYEQFISKSSQMYLRKWKFLQSYEKFIIISQ